MRGDHGHAAVFIGSYIGTLARLHRPRRTWPWRRLRCRCGEPLDASGCAALKSALEANSATVGLAVELSSPFHKVKVRRDVINDLPTRTATIINPPRATGDAEARFVQAMTAQYGEDWPAQLKLSATPYQPERGPADHDPDHPDLPAEPDRADEPEPAADEDPAAGSSRWWVNVPIVAPDIYIALAMGDTIARAVEDHDLVVAGSTTVSHDEHESVRHLVFCDRRLPDGCTARCRRRSGHPGDCSPGSIAPEGQ